MKLVGCRCQTLPRDLMPWDVAYRWFTKVAPGRYLGRVHDGLRRWVRIGAGQDPEPLAAVIDAQSIRTGASPSNCRPD